VKDHGGRRPRASCATDGHHGRADEATKRTHERFDPPGVPLTSGGRSASMAAAPGAGKTPFAASTFLQLIDTVDVGRALWFVPTCNLRRQVRNELAIVGA